MIGVLRHHAAVRPDKRALVELEDGERELGALTYGTLDRAARSLAVRLRAEGLAGEPVLFLYPNGLDFMVAFWACLYAGVYPVPAVLPEGPSRFWRKLDAIAADARPAAVLSTAESFECSRSGLDGTSLSRLRRIATDRGPWPDPETWKPPEIDASSLAFLQYTSGSTRAPRGVEVSHGNLLHNHHLMLEAYGLGGDDLYVSWLPLYHDLGLIGNFLHCIYLGATLVILTPAAFVQKPGRWLRAITRYRASASFGPNFAYELCVRRVSEAERRELDLGSWTVAVNGAEPVRAATLRRFSAAFGPCGYRNTTWNPAYGLAEATLTVSATPIDEPPRVALLDPEAYAEGKVRTLGGGDGDGLLLVSAGRVVGQEVRIVDPETRRPLAVDEVGEVWVRGGSVARGYRGQEAASAEVFDVHLVGVDPPDDSGFLRTGDLGFFFDGHLYLSGRCKDLILLRGRNIYPQDLELTASEAHPALRPGRTVCFSVSRTDLGDGGSPDTTDEDEQVVVVQEVSRDRIAGLDSREVLRRIRHDILDEHEVDPRWIVLLPPDVLPKTSSGKLQRPYTRELLLGGELREIARLDRGQAESAIRAQPLPRSDLERRLLEIVAAVLGREPETIDPGASLAHHGLDSAALLGLSGQVSEALGRPLAPTDLYRHPTIRRLAEHLTREGEAPPAAEPERRTAPKREPGHAVLGIGCRLPGGIDSPEELWELVIRGGGAVGPAPSSRRELIAGFRPGPLLQAGYLEDVSGFDAGFFGLGAGEAAALDPQQRILLEVTWHALEDAGIPPSALAGRRVGVFLGISYSDYARLGAGTRAGRGIWAGVGGALSIAANRLSYAFDLRGPSLAIDTACSSSLVALHDASRSLRMGECELALVGGVNLVLDPEVTTDLEAAGMMAADGRCKVFDARADGYVRGEGATMLVLAPLGTKWARARRIRAVVRGSAVGQDGRSNGLTAPNGLAQESVLGEALGDAGLEPAQIDLVEAHGTGTPLGDPIEVDALAGVYGRGREPERPLQIGSVKANVGHLESAAGAVGLVKAILALERETVPPQPLFEVPNPHIPWQRLPVVVPRAPRPWPREPGRPRRAGVSSFGFGGTNAHVVVEEGPAFVPEADSEREPAEFLLPLAAATPSALRQLAAAHAARLEEGAALADLCSSAALGRSHAQPYRALVAARDVRQMIEALARPEAVARAASRGVALLFAGQGGDPRAPVESLERIDPVFGEALDLCVGAVPGLDPRALLRSDRPLSTAEAQPALFALQYALGRLWLAWLEEPVAVLGHSVGELAAAALCGVFTPEEGMRLAAARGDGMQRLAPTGAMATVFLARDELEEALGGVSEVSVAAFNSPRQVVLSGSSDAIEAALEQLTSRGVEARRLEVERAFHSPRIEPALAELRRHLESMELRPPDPGLVYVSGRTGRRAGPELATVEYWVGHAREPVRFADGLRSLEASGCRALVEIGSGAALAAFARETLKDKGVAVVPSLRRTVAPERQLSASLGKLWQEGAEVDWQAFWRPFARRPISLPLYPFEHRSYWLEAEPGLVEAGDAAPTCAEVVWEDGGPLQDPAAPPPGEDLAAELARTPVDPELEAWSVAMRRLDEVSLEVFGQTLRELGYREREGAGPEAAEICAELGIRSAYAPLVRRWTTERFRDGWPSAGGNEGESPLRRLRSLARSDPEIAPEQALVASCADALGPVLRGEVDPLERLFPGGRPDLAAAAYTRSLPGRRLNALLARLLEELVPDAGGFRVLEVGAGTGATTRSLLPVLAARPDAEYTFTDLSSAFLRAARAELGDRGLRTARFDAEQDPLEQGFELGAYDVVVAANVLHATRDLRRTTRHVARLLRPGGHLLLFEAFEHRPWLDLCFGLTDGWWRFADGRSGGPLLDVEGWREILAGEGFTTITSPTASSPLGRALGQGLLVARRSWSDAGRGTWWIRAGNDGVLQEALARAVRSLGGRPVSDLEAADASLRGLVLARAPGPVEDLERLEDAAKEGESFLAPIREAAGQDLLDGCTVVAMTHGAVTPDPEAAADPVAALWWGLASSLGLERPETPVLRLDVASREPTAWGRALADHLLRPQDEEVAVVNDRRRLPRLVSREPVSGTWRPAPDRVYLVTGGLGGLGLALARWLAERGARRLMLTGRRAPRAEASEVLHELRARGIGVETTRADVGDAPAVHELLMATRRLGPLGGVFHAAGVSGGGSVAELGIETLEEVLRPKVDGALHLHRATAVEPPEIFVFFSSGAAVWGAAEQGAYAAANRCLDQLAHHRRRVGLPALSINWGYLPDGGLVEGLDGWYRRLGLLPLGASLAFDHMARLLASGAVQATVARVEWDRLAEVLNAGRRRRLLDRLASAGPPRDNTPVVASTGTPGSEEATDDLRQRFERARGEARRQLLDSALQEMVAASFEGPRRELDRSLSLTELGFDSLMAVDLGHRLERQLGLSAPLSRLLGGNPLGELAEALLGEYGPAERAAAPETTQAVAHRFPLSEGQRALWHLHRRNPEDPSYHVVHVARLRPGLDLERLSRALDALCARHPMLRVRFEEEAGVASQRIDPPRPLPIERHEVVAAEEVEAWIDRLADRPFDLDQGPLRADLLSNEGRPEILVLGFHHLVVDFRALEVIFRDLEALDRAEEGGPELEPPSVSYPEFVSWQAEHLEGAEGASLQEHWRQRLADAPRLDLPTDRPRPARSAGRGAQVSRFLSESLVEGLEGTARGLGVTPFVLALSVFGRVLARAASARRAVIGVPALGRRPGDETTVGYFVNLLPIELAFETETLAELTSSVREEVTSAFDHQHLPFRRMSGPGEADRVRAVFVWDRYRDEVAQGQSGGLFAERLRSEQRGAATDLAVTVFDRGARVEVDWRYAADLFDATTVRRWAGRFESLLAQVVDRPDHPLADLSDLPAAERHQLLVEWSTDRTVGSLGLLQDPVRRTIEAQPEAVAVVDARGHLSYGELGRRSRRLAARIQAHGLGESTRVGLLLGRSADLVIGVLGVLEAGGAYVPLDPAAPDARLRWMFEDAELDAVLVEPGWRERCGTGILRLSFDLGDQAAEGSSPEVAPVSPDPARLAYMTYTSGSSGRPKAVLTPHRGVVAMLGSDGEALRTTQAHRILHFVEISFDAATLHLFRALYAGATVVLAERDLLRSPRRLEDTLARERIDLCSFPASVLAAMEGAELRLPALRTLTVGAEACPPAVARRWSRGRRLFNMYGPTETAIVTSRGRLHQAPDEEAPAGEIASPPGIGRPVGAARVWIGDRRLHPVPAGSEGELLVGGEAVAWGYHGRPGLTAERFVPDPSPGSAPGARLYRTGDRARVRSDGSLEFRGRLDEQLKIRGLRIEPGEVETALTALGGVARAVVVAREDRPGDRRLVGYVTASESAVGRLDGGSLRAGLAEQLPAHLVPAAVVVLESFPLTERGKIDPSRLPPPGAEKKTFEAPESRLEALVAGVWAEVLDRSDCGRGDDFFTLGGHSLMAAQVQARLEEALGRKVSLELLFELPVLADLAAELGREARIEPGLLPGPPAGTTSAPGARFPLSFGQARLWFLHRLRPGETAHNMVGAFRLRGRLDPGRLRRALAVVIERHHVLRSRFAEDEGVPFQEVLSADGMPLPVVDLEALAGDVVLDELLASEVRHRFDLSRGPLFRAVLARRNPREHVLILNQHHIVSDGWSLSLLWQETSEIYRAGVEGRSPSLPELSLQYGDYAAWQRRSSNDEALAPHLEAWRQELAGAPEEIALPTDGNRGDQTAAAPVSRVCLPGLGPALDGLARARGATLFMVLLALLAALLGRLAGQHDLVIGSPVANRRSPALERLIGFFLDTLALRVELRSGESFIDLLQRVRARVLAARERQQVPFERLVRVLRPERQTGRHPLFQVFFNLVNVPPPDLGLPDVEIETLRQHEPLSKFDLTLYAHALDDELRLDLTYDPDLFDRRRMEELLHQLESLARQAVAAPERPLAELVLPFPARDADPTRTFDEGLAPTLLELFLARARKHPDRAAVVDADGSVVSWRALAAGSESRARRLRGAGARPETVVAVRGERREGAWGRELLMALLAVLRSGAAFWIVDSAHPEERLRRQRREIERATGVRVLDFEAAVEQEETADLPEDPEADGHPESLAYVATTSGSSGEPKVIAGRLGSLAFATDWLCRQFELGPGDAFGALSGLSHDPLHRDLFLGLAAGATVHFPPGGARTSGRLAPWLAARRVTVSNLTPSLGRLVWSDAEAGSLPALRRVFFGGERLMEDDVAALSRVAPRVRICNVYGTTETSQALACAVVSKELRRQASLPIGDGVVATRLHLLTSTGRAAGLGEVAELCFESPHLSRGYLGAPRLTAERFVPAAGGGRIYLTGDLGRWQLDGTVEILGRRDGQVQVRGYRIEPAEITAALRRHPAVKDAAVVPWRDSLAAYLVAATPGDTLPDGGDLRRLLEEALPPAWIPGAFLPLDELPRTTSGKLDLRALPEPHEAAGLRSPGPPRAAGSPLEETIADVWGELLGRSEIGRDENFFDLGGHSLLATRVLSRVRELCGVSLEVADLFAAPTVAGLALRIGARNGTGVNLPPLGEPEPAGVESPLSFAQERLWFLDRLEGPGAAYNVPAALRLGGQVEIDVLRRVLEAIMSRHEVLRARFVEREGLAVQVVERELGCDLEIEELASSDPARRLAELAAIPFDLSRGPLVRWTLLRPPGEPVLVAVFHHAVIDGWSLGLLVRELQALYACFAGSGSPPRLPALQYADFARWQRRVAPQLEPQLGWWKEQLADLPPALELPLDRPRPPVARHRGRTLERRLPETLVAALRRAGRRSGASLFMVLLAAYATLLQRLSGQRDLAVGTAVANRRDPRCEGLIGFFANTLVLRLRTSRDPSWEEMLAAARRTVLDASARQDVPFEQVVDAVSPRRSLARAPLFQTLLVLQNTPGTGPPLQENQAAENGELEIEPLAVSTGASRFDLSLAAVERVDGDLRLALEIDTDLFDPSTGERWLDHLEVILRAVAAASENEEKGSFGSLPWTTAVQRHQVLEWGRPRPSVTRSADPLARLEGSRQRRPDAAALELLTSDGGVETVTYRALDHRARTFARLLVGRGVGPERRVGIALPRNGEMVAAILGTLRAGGVYVPLDLSWPAERLRFAATDSGIECLIAARREGWMSDSLELIRPEDVLGAPAATDALPPVGPDHAAYVIYTSGSTGRPKGVVLTHRGLSNLMLAQRESFSVGPGDRVLQFGSPAFDASVSEIFVTLGAGATLLLPGDLDLLDQEDPGQVLRRRRITHVTLPPSLLRVLSPADLPVAKTVVSAGEAMTPELVETWADHCRFLDAYGPTEGTVCATDRRCLPGGSSGIGRPIRGVSLVLLDAGGRLVPAGVTGEICLGGKGVARGYLGDPRRTAAAFVPSAFEGAGERLYRTGDLARWRTDGSLDFLGRGDRQVQVRGFRVEPGEIEAVVASLPGVSGAAVGWHEPLGWVAWVVSEAFDPAQADEALVARLPAHMRPSRWVPLESLPLTSSGKVDRSRLPLPARQEPAGGETSEARDDLERLLAELWCEVLGLARVGIHDNFFALGGDSISSLRLAAAARRRGLELTARLLFQHQTVAELAVAARRNPVALPSLARPEGEIPLTSAQAWFLATCEVDRHHFNQSVLLTVDPSLAPTDLERMVTCLANTHDACRLRFDVDPEDGVRQAYGNPGFGFEQQDLSADDWRTALAAEAERWQRSFDLSAGPLFRAVYFEVADPGERPRLLLLAHHLVVDAVSWQVLLADLDRLGRRALAGEELSLPVVPCPFGAWALRAPGRVAGRSLSRAIRSDEPEVRNRVRSAARLELVLAPEQASALTAGGSAGGIVDLLLAGLARAVVARSGPGAVWIDLESHGRDTDDGVDLSRTVGWLTRLQRLELHVEALEGIEAARAAVASVRDSAVADGFDRLRGGREPEVDPILVNYLGRLDGASAFGSGNGPFALAGEEIGAVRGPDQERSHWLELSAWLRDGALHLVWTYNPRRNDPAEIEALARTHLEGLERLAGIEEPVSVDPLPEGAADLGLDGDSLDDLLSDLPSF